MGEAGDHFVGRDAIRNPGCGVDLPGLHEFDDAAMLGGGAVARGEQGDFLAVKIGIVEGNVTHEQAHENQLAAVGDEFEGALHGLRITGAIEDQRGRRDLFGSFVASLQGIVLLGEGAPFCAEVDEFDLGAGDLKKLDYREADGTSADHQNTLAGRRLAAQDGVRTDSERFHEGELRVRELGVRVEMRGWNQEAFAHAAIDVDAEDLEAFAAVGFAAETGLAVSTVEVGINGAPVAHLNAAGAIAQGEHFDSQLMAKDARVAKERLAPAVGVEIGATDTNAQHTDESLSGGRRLRFRRVVPGELARLFKNQITHISSLSERAYTQKK